ncbi:hypothetical protein NEPAR08_0280 [Nematocida parisii]|nr:hypothetical protein NEPAR08_0280 [Nematocida parisii]KAI5126209.1 hypothetical protein NEPAR03_0381 [Nematocida parisii]
MYKSQKEKIKIKMNREPGHGVVSQCIKEWREYLVQEKGASIKKIQAMQIKNTFKSQAVMPQTTHKQEDSEETRKRLKKVSPPTEKMDDKAVIQADLVEKKEVGISTAKNSVKEENTTPSSVNPAIEHKSIKKSSAAPTTTKGIKDVKAKINVSKASKELEKGKAKEEVISKEAYDKKIANKLKYQKKKQAEKEKSAGLNNSRNTKVVLNKSKDSSDVPQKKEKKEEKIPLQNDQMCIDKKLGKADTPANTPRPNLISPLSLFEKMNPTAAVAGQDSLVIVQKPPAEPTFASENSKSTVAKSANSTAPEKQDVPTVKAEKEGIKPALASSQEGISENKVSPVIKTEKEKEEAPASASSDISHINTSFIPIHTTTSIGKDVLSVEVESKKEILISESSPALKESASPQKPSTSLNTASSTKKAEANTESVNVRPSVISNVSEKEPVSALFVQKESIPDIIKVDKKDLLKKLYNESSTEIDNQKSKNIHLSSTLSVAHSVDESNFERLLPLKNEITVEVPKKEAPAASAPHIPNKIVNNRRKDRPNQSFVGLKPEELKEKTFELNKLLMGFKNKIKKEQPPQQKQPEPQKNKDASDEQKEKPAEPEQVFTPVIDFSDDDSARGINYNKKWVDSPSLPRKLLMQSEDQAEKIFGSSVNTKVNLKEMFSTLTNLPADSPTKMT